LRECYCCWFCGFSADRRCDILIWYHENIGFVVIKFGILHKVAFFMKHFPTKSMGKAGSKVKNYSKIKKNNINDFQVSLKNRFYEIANGGSTIDKSVFFKYTESTICPQLQLFLYDSLSKPDNVVTVDRFVQFAEMILGDFNQQARALLQLNQPIKQVVTSININKSYISFEFLLVAVS
uniref:RGS domain-containing protein n=1 Tax=Brugia timori TaxID=42155 RepID=A0A0R3QDH1_9BILA